MDEFALIDRFVSCFDVDETPSGPGDDAAVLAAQKPSCITMDSVVEGVHFTRRTFRFDDIGHKALAVNLSDLAAMGAKPTWFTVALGINRITSKELTSLGRGMASLARVHGTKLIGGNVTRAASLSITITAAGETDHPLLRSNAREGDLIFVTGPLGDAAAGLEFKQLINAQRRPTPHLAFIHSAKRFVHAAIDVSDGLLQDLGHVCRASKLGAALDSASIPLSKTLTRVAGTRALDFALRGGEDYVLLLAAPPHHRDVLEQLGAFEIGVFTHSAGVRVDGKLITGRTGHQHFR